MLVVRHVLPGEPQAWELCGIAQDTIQICLRLACHKAITMVRRPGVSALSYEPADHVVEVIYRSLLAGWGVVATFESLAQATESNLAPAASTPRPLVPRQGGICLVGGKRDVGGFRRCASERSQTEDARRVKYIRAAHH